MEMICNPYLFKQIRSKLRLICASVETTDAKWKYLISEAKYNEVSESALPPALDPESSTASNETFNHFENYCFLQETHPARLFL